MIPNIRNLKLLSLPTKKKLICLILGSLILAVYWQVQYHDFINYDDNRYITENKYIKSGFSKESIIWAFTTSHASNWHPVTWLSHILDIQLYGLNPKGHHLTSLALHIANSLLLFLVFARMTGAIWKSCFIASLFAFHPINIESVAWAAERKSVLSTFFWFLTMWTYVHYIQKKTLAKYSILGLFFALGLMSKPMLVTLPFVFLLLDHWPLNRLEIVRSKIILSNGIEDEVETKNSFLYLLFEKAPLLILASGSCIITFLVQKWGGALVPLETISSTTRINNALVSYIDYLGKMVWPKSLSIFYPYPIDELYFWKGLASGLILICITLVAIRLIKKVPYLAVGWFWYLGTLIPVIGLVQVGQQSMADRYAYIPLIGIFIIIAWGLSDLLENYSFKKKILPILTGIFFSLLITLTWTQLQYWKNSIKLFKHTIEVTEKKYPSFAGMYNNLGVALINKTMYEEAIIPIKESIKMQPSYSEAHNNLGNALFGLKRFSEANNHYKKAIRLNPNYFEAHINLANSLSKSSIFDKKALIHYKKAIQLKPEHPEAHFNLGVTLNKQNNSDQAIFHLEESIKLNPNFAEAHLALGNIHLVKNNFKKALYHFESTIKFDPDNFNAHNGLGSIVGQRGDLEKAIVHFENAIKIKPDFFQAHNNLGVALSTMGQIKKSDYHFKIAKDLAMQKEKNKYQILKNRSWNNAIKYIKSAATLDDLPKPQPNENGYSFYIAGHAYGKPGAKSKGLYDPFTKNFHIINDYDSMKFGFLLGDVVEEASEKAWQLVKKDLNILDSRIKNFVVPGNHDVGMGTNNYKRDIFLQQFGKTFFSFEHKKDLFIILDGNIDGWNISGEQLQFFKQSLRNKRGFINNIFIFSHQLVWQNTSNPKFSAVIPNTLEGRSKYLNFWTKVFPLLADLNNDIYFFSGDIGASPNSSELFYTKFFNVTFVATGMGSGGRDNFLILSVIEGAVKIFFVPIN